MEPGKQLPFQIFHELHNIPKADKESPYFLMFESKTDEYLIRLIQNWRKCIDLKSRDLQFTIWNIESCRFKNLTETSFHVLGRHVLYTYVYLKY